MTCKVFVIALFREGFLLQLSCDYDTSNATRLQDQNFIVGAKLGSFRIFFCWRGGVDEIGFVSRFLTVGVVGRVQIGFVSRKRQQCETGGTVNWVRFAFLAFHRSAAAEIGFVSYNTP